MRPRLLLLLAVVFAVGGLTGCHDDYDRYPRRTYHRPYHRYDDNYYRRPYVRDYDRPYYRDGYYGSRSQYYSSGPSVTIRPY